MFFMGGKGYGIGGGGLGGRIVVYIFSVNEYKGFFLVVG